MKPKYFPNFVDNPDALFEHLYNLSWLSPKIARKELFMSHTPRTYTYGNQDFVYTSEPFSPQVLGILGCLGSHTYNVCFLNRYDEARNALGWHADDSPEVDSSHPIAVISVGAEREIWWKPQGFKGEVPHENRQLLEHGSLFIMPAGFQQVYFHKIPRHDRPCGVRISLTFRQYS